MANILQLVQHLKIGGLEKMALALAGKSQYAENVAIVALEGKKQQAVSQWPELAEFERLACLNKPPKVSWKTVKKLIALVDHWQIDVVHSHHIGPMLYASLVQLFRPKLRHVSTVHDAWYLQNNKARWITKLACLFKPITVVADANAVAEEWKQKVSKPTDHVIINGVDCDYFSPVSKSICRQKLNLPTNRVLVGCAARLEEGKGHDVLISSLSNMPAHQHLVFAGSGSQLEKLRALAHKCGVAHRVHWLGCVQQMATFYSAIDVFCLFSEREGLPLTVLESMSCNTPVVASDVGGVSEVIDSETGILLPLNQKHLLPFSICKALALNKGMVVRKHALLNRDINNMAGQYDQVYQSLAL